VSDANFGKLALSGDATAAEHRRWLFGLAAILLVVLIWSGWIIVSSWGIHQVLTPWDITFLRFSTAALVTAPLLWRRRSQLATVFNLKVAICALGCGFPYTMASFLGLARSPASNAGVVVNGMLPILVAVISFLWFRQKIPSSKRLGIALIATANGLILLEGGSTHLAGLLLLLSAAVFLATYTVCMRAWNVPVDTLLVATPWINALVFLPIWLLAPTALRAASMSEIWLQILYQGVLVSVVALFLMTHAIHILGSVTASTFMGLVPVVAAGLAFVVLGEPLTPLTLVSVGLCSIGIAAYNLRKSKH
jgi:drug/metabolite transporter (DMT)-like permease